MRQYNYFCVQKTYHVPGGAAGAAGVDVWVAMRVESTFLLSNNLYQDLNFERRSVLETQNPIPNIEVESTVAGAARRGLVGEIKFTLVSTDANNVYAPFGTRYVTSIIFSLELSLRHVADVLRGHQFVFGPNNSPYTVIPGSIIEKKRKKTTPHLG